MAKKKARQTDSGLWLYPAGSRPYTVTVYERERGGLIYARAWDATARNGAGVMRRVSLGHRDKERAKKYANVEAGKLAEGASRITEARFTLSQVFSRYLKHRTPNKAKSEQQADERRAELWLRVVGNIDPHVISSAKWEGFISARGSGAIDARGNPVAEKNRKPVRARSVEADCVWLWLVFNWAAKWKLESGRYLMRENPVRGYTMPREENPKRPVATQERFEAIRAVSDSQMMEVRPNGKRIQRRSYLSELLDISNGTGRRLNAICSLRFEDLRLERTKAEPFGAIVWPASTDKKKKERRAPINARVRDALDRILAERPGIGSVPLFPSPTDPTKPISRHLADSWLRGAEKLAGLDPQPGSLWHAYRRKWGTERKHMSPKDVAAAGGWESIEALQKSYQQADEATMLEVVLGGGELRAVK